jgi:hypothetical protein
MLPSFSELKVKITICGENWIAPIVHILRLVILNRMCSGFDSNEIWIVGSVWVITWP